MSQLRVNNLILCHLAVSAEGFNPSALRNGSHQRGEGGLRRAGVRVAFSPNGFLISGLLLPFPYNKPYWFVNSFLALRAI
jgi:hypothetical protein